MNRRDKKKGKKSLLWILSRTKRLCYICWTIKPFRSENPVVSVQAEFWQLVLKKTFGQYYSELYFISFLSLIFSTLFPGQGQSVWGEVKGGTVIVIVLEFSGNWHWSCPNTYKEQTTGARWKYLLPMLHKVFNSHEEKADLPQWRIQVCHQGNAHHRRII